VCTEPPEGFQPPLLDEYSGGIAPPKIDIYVAELSFKGGLKIRPKGGIDPEEAKCLSGLSVQLEAAGCLRMGIDKYCANVGGKGEGTTEYAMVCKEPPQYSCDLSNYCWDGNGKFLVDVGKYWVFGADNPLKFGVWKIKAGCTAEVGGKLGGEVQGQVKKGPLCEGCDLHILFGPKFRAEASAQAGCDVEVFGKKLVNVTGKLAVCGRLGVKGGWGCGLQIKLTGGAAAKVALEQIKIGWITIGGAKKVWPWGDGCWN